MYWRLIRYTCAAFIGLWFLNALANMFYWYASIWWFDIMMHTFGGVAVALAASALFVRRYAHQKMIVPVLLGVFIVGLAWEYYEYALQHIIRGAELANIPDSISDIIADMVGGGIGVYLAIRTQRRYNR